MSGEPPVWGGGAVDGPGWSALMAWTGLALGVAALLFAFAAPLGSQPAGIVWVAAFGAIAVWFGLVGGRRARGPRRAADASDPATDDSEDRAGIGRTWRVSSIAGLIGAALGAFTIAVMAYAWLALLLVDLPVPPAWEVPAEVPLAPFSEV